VKSLAKLVLLMVLVAVAGFVYWRMRRPELPPAPTGAQIQALVERRDALQARFQELVAARGERSIAEAPQGDVMIGLPTALTGSILTRVVTGLFDGMTLTLRNLHAHKQGDVIVKMLFGRRRVGRYVLDAHIHEVRGILAPGPPELQFSPGRVAVSLPVRLVGGSGRADVRLQWQSKGFLASVVCGDEDVTKAISAAVVPKDYVLKGTFDLASSGETIVLRPELAGRQKVRIFVEPTEQAWRAFDEVIRAQRAGCSAALTRIDLKEILGHLVEKGFDVKIPERILKPIRLPAGVRQSLEMQGIRVALDVKATGLELDADRLWYAANVDLELSEPTRARSGLR
jgi:hypothetical protein